MVPSSHLLRNVPIFSLVYFIETFQCRLVSCTNMTSASKQTRFCSFWFHALSHWTCAMKCNYLLIYCNVFRCFEKLLAIFYKPIPNMYSGKLLFVLRWSRVDLSLYLMKWRLSAEPIYAVAAVKIHGECSH